MARDTVILSPEYAGNTGRREALAVGSAIKTGVFVQYVAGGFEVSTAAAGRQMVSTENISTAQDLDYIYTIGENVFAAALPAGCLVNVKAVDATYNAGDVVEIGAAGEVTALAAGVAVGVVPSFGGEVITGEASLMIQLL